MSGGREIMAGGNEYSAEPVIERLLGEAWYQFGQVTERIGRKRVTFPMRRERARLYREAEAARKTERSSAARKESRVAYKEQKRLEGEFVDQMDFTVASRWGDLGIKYTILNREVTADRTPIVVVPGASNGMESMDSLVRELAKRRPDRKIIVAGYPDAPSGTMTREFATAVKLAEGFEPHVEIFRQVIGELVKDGNIELWGFSAGGAIVEKLLTDGVVASRVENAVLISPAASVKMTETELKLGLLHENLGLLKFLGDLPRYVFVDDKTKDEQKKWKFSTWIELGKRCCQDMTEETLGKMMTRSGGKILVVSGGDDLVTKASERFNLDNLDKLRTKQTNLSVAVVPQSTHAGPFLHPERYLDEIDVLLGKNGQ